MHQHELSNIQQREHTKNKMVVGRVDGDDDINVRLPRLVVI